MSDREEEVWNKLVEEFDANKDGVIHRDEIEAVVQGWIEKYNLEPDYFGDLVKQYMEVDGDGNDEITWEEFKAKCDSFRKK